MFFSLHESKHYNALEKFIFHEHLHIMSFHGLWCYVICFYDLPTYQSTAVLWSKRIWKNRNIKKYDIYLSSVLSVNLIFYFLLNWAAFLLQVNLIRWKNMSKLLFNTWHRYSGLQLSNFNTRIYSMWVEVIPLLDWLILRVSVSH